MGGFRRLLDRLDEFVAGVPNHNITPSHFDSLDPDVQHNLEDHVANNPHPLFEKDDSVTDEHEDQPEAAAEPDHAGEPAPAPAADDSGRVAPA